MIESHLDAVRDGPTGLSLEGEPGIGKTAVWRAAVDLAKARDYRVLAATPARPDATLAFSGLVDLLDRVPQEAIDELPAPPRQALKAALWLEETETGAHDPGAVPRGLLLLLRRLAEDGAVMVAIDDEQWLDRASARALAHALCRLDRERICVLIARRPSGESLLWPELERGFARSGLEATRLGLLDIPTIEHLVAAELTRPVGRSLLHRLAETSGGNPLYALALARELNTRPHAGAGAGELSIPASLTAAIAQRLQHIEEAAGDALLVVAAASHPTIGLLQAVLRGFTLSQLDGAARAGVVEIAGDRVFFTHPLLASTHYESTPAKRRREVHRRLAAVIEDEEQRAYHLARGAEAPDRRLASQIELAAEPAVRRGAPESGADLLVQAARLTPADAVDVRRSRIIAAAELYEAGGDFVSARELLEPLIPELPRGPVRARALQALAEGCTDHATRAVSLLEQAAEEAGDHYRLLGEIETLLSVCCSITGDFRAEVAHADAALAAAERAGDRVLLSRALSTHAQAAFSTGLGVDRDALQRAVELEDPTQPTHENSPSGTYAEVLFWADDYAEARPRYERHVARLRDRGEMYYIGATVFEFAILEWYAGNRDAARSHLSSARELIRDRGEHDLDLWLRWGEALFAAGDGELERARVVATEAIQMAEQMTNMLIHCLPVMVLAAVHIWSGEPAAAHDLLHPTRERLLAKGFGFMGSLSLGLWSYDVEALIADGRRTEAELVVDDLLSRAIRAENPNAIAIAHRCHGLLLGAEGRIDDAIQAMHTALSAHAERPLAPEVARTLLEQGVLQRRAKQKNAAKQSIDRALAMFEEIGAPMWVARARDELNRIGLRRPRPSEGLTPAQQRVAELVAAGMSNREIATTLYMSLRSVEAHLTKVYREYGVRSRAQLATVLATSPRPEGVSVLDPESRAAS